MSKNSEICERTRFLILVIIGTIIGICCSAIVQLIIISLLLILALFAHNSDYNGWTFKAGDKIGLEIVLNIIFGILNIDLILLVCPYVFHILI